MTELVSSEAVNVSNRSASKSLFVRRRRRFQEKEKEISEKEKEISEK